MTGAASLIIDGQAMTADQALASIVGRPKPTKAQEQKTQRMRELLRADPATVKADLPEPNDPSPEEIRSACRKIRREWSPREMARRTGVDFGFFRWLPPEVAYPNMVPG